MTLFIRSLLAFCLLQFPLFTVQIDTFYGPTDSEEIDILVKSKFRGVDPWILLEGNVVPLSAMDPVFGKEYQTVKQRIANGWGIKFHEKDVQSNVHGH